MSKFGYGAIRGCGLMLVAGQSSRRAKRRASRPPLSLAIDNIRRRLQSELPPDGKRYLKGSRYLLLRNREDLTKKQRVRLQDLLRLPANETLNAA